MHAALWLSVKQSGLCEQVLKDYEKQLPMLLAEAELNLSDSDVEPILSYLVHDKKNHGERPQFVLLESVARPVLDVEVPMEVVRLSLEDIIMVWKQ